MIFSRELNKRQTVNARYRVGDGNEYRNLDPFLQLARELYTFMM